MLIVINFVSTNSKDMKTETETINVKCPACKGEGTVEKFNCHNSSNECCGGCYIDVTCENCNGRTEIEISIDDIEEILFEAFDNGNPTVNKL